MANNLISYFPQYLDAGAIFTQMVTLGAPWSSEVGKEMDDAYLSMYSGVKTPSKFTVLHSVNGVASAQSIAKLLWSMYGQSWKRLWDGYNIKYSPIDNYNVQETMARTQNNDRGINRTTDTNSSVNGTAKDTTDMNESVNGSINHGHVVQKTGNDTTSVYGFNSQESVPSDVTSATGTDTNSGTDTQTNTTDTTGTVDTVTSNTTVGKVTDVTTDTDDETENLQRTKTGNVGQNSYQELLRQEFDLWRWNFFTQVFEDCDKYLVLSVYDPCQFSSVN